MCGQTFLYTDQHGFDGHKHKKSVEIRAIRVPRPTISQRARINIPRMTKKNLKFSVITLRDVEKSDLPIFFENQVDPEAIYMAGFTAKDPADRAAFDQHWTKVLADESIFIKTILVSGEVAGSVLSHCWFGDPEVSYWIGKVYWGKGIATRALKLFLEGFSVRPLYARIIIDNHASKRVLEKCGFVAHGKDQGFANARGMEVEEYIFKLS